MEACGTTTVGLSRRVLSPTFALAKASPRMRPSQRKKRFDGLIFAVGEPRFGV